MSRLTWRSARLRACGKGSPLFRFARVAGLCVAGLWVTYVLAINLFLSTSLFSRVVNATPRTIDVHYERGWSLIPTRIHARNLSIRASDSNVEWILKLDEVTFGCSLLDLARMRFHVTFARGSGIEFRMRQIVESPRATEAYRRWLPPIEGFPALGIKPSEPPSPDRWSDEAWHLWTISLDDVIAEHVREVWFDDLRYAGDARIAGGFYLKPIRQAEITPIAFDLRSGAVQLEGRDALSALSAAGTFALASFDPRVTSHGMLLRLLQLDVAGEGAISDLAASALSSREVSLRGSARLPRFALRVEDGAVLDGTRIEARAEVLEARFGEEHALSGRAAVDVRVARGRLAATGWLRDLALDEQVRAPRVALAADSGALQLIAPLTDLHAEADLPLLTVDDAAQAERALRPHESGRVVRRGAVRGSAHLEGWRASRRLRGTVALRGEALVLSDGEWTLSSPRVDVTVSGDAALTSQTGRLQLRLLAPRVDVARREARIVGELSVLVEAATPAEGSLRPRDEPIELTGSRIEVRHAAVGGAAAGAEWEGLLALSRASLSLKHEPRFAGELSLDARDATPLLDFLLRDGPPRALLESLASMPRLAARTSVAVDGASVVFPDIVAGGGDLSAKGFFLDAAGRNRGAFVVQKGAVSAGIGVADDGVHLRLFGLDDWLQRERASALGAPSRPAL